MANTDIKNLSVQDKNIIITEKLFGYKVIIPRQYYAKLKGKSAEEYRRNAEFHGDAPLIVEGNKPLKTHSIQARPLPDFYDEKHSHGLLSQARLALEQKGLHFSFVQALIETITPARDGSQNAYLEFYWRLVSASNERQADAIVQVLLQEKH